MMRCVTTALLLACLLAFQSNAQSALDKAKEDSVFRVPTDDKHMAAAMRKARITLPDFLSLAKNPKPSMKSFGVKVAVPTDDGHEYFWVRPFEDRGTEFVGRLRNSPRAAKNLKLNDLISFPQDNIVDWTYLDNDKMKGNFTACALLKRETKENAEAFKRQYGLECDP